MRRWTDGKLWSTSRVSGSFFIYQEMKGKRKGGEPPRHGVEKIDNIRETNRDQAIDSDRLDGRTCKPERLMKQLYSITTSTGNHLHLISYYSRSHLNSPKLPRPTTDPKLHHIVPIKGMYLDDHIRKSLEPIAIREFLRLSSYGQRSHKQLQMQGSIG
jgi:Gti1/Pac2 family transcription factor